MEFYRDNLGNQIGEVYSTMLVNPYFERKLKAFDPNLKLMFDQIKKKWVILELAPDNSGWNILLNCEDDFGNPMPLTDHIFDHLKDMRRKYDLRFKDPNKYFDDLLYEADRQKEEIETRASVNHKARLLEDVNEWRKASRELQGRPTSDVTAGYRKITPKTRGIIYGSTNL